MRDELQFKNAIKLNVRDKLNHWISMDISRDFGKKRRRKKVFENGEYKSFFGNCKWKMLGSPAKYSHYIDFLSWEPFVGEEVDLAQHTGMHDSLIRNNIQLKDLIAFHRGTFLTHPSLRLSPWRSDLHLVENFQTSECTSTKTRTFQKFHIQHKLKYPFSI